ncbi:thiamine pyrophosphate-binding protein [Actinocrispum wychmicini]|uniref:Acetolactate synthase-1/2/3 large subunit n=1 Tax=Actinocrispum wychmicini TaxID=1213861 RepID=A0A4R2K453_9PSEU|nr:thiamine pyrophosphate-binding protein [Actinocrispum wychmicini]TCO61115.1 acetolactate synthase-1/2/3 large subunit [Actinocrispum wychmicini]
MINDTVAATIVRYLRHFGIDTAFGIPGLYNMPLFDALRKSDMHVVTVRHEQGAAFMADGYARATGRPAAVVTLPGCGVLNAMTGLSEAYADSSPVLLLSTQVAKAHIDNDGGLLHELTGQFDVVDAVMKHSERLYAAGGTVAVCERAFQALAAGRPRPVQIELPLDVQDELVTAPESGGVRWDDRPRTELSSEAATELERALKAVAAAERPLVIAGGGVVTAAAAAELTTFAERLGAPVLTTGMGVGSIPGDHPLACGVSWIAAADVTGLVATADAVVAIGTRFNQGMTAEWGLALPETTLRIDVDAAEIERNIPTRYRVVGDAKLALAAALGHLNRSGVDRAGKPDEAMAAAQRAYVEAQHRRVGSTRPWFDALRGALPDDAVIAADMSLFWADMLGSFPVAAPRQVLFPWGMGTLGFGVPAAIGAKIGVGARSVVSIAGDGAFQFTGAELGTAVQQRLALPFVVANNNAYGMIKMQQLGKYGADIAVDLPAPDFVALATAYGAHGVRVERPEELAIALKDAFVADGPTVIEVPWGTSFARPE